MFWLVVTWTLTSNVQVTTFDLNVPALAEPLCPTPPSPCARHPLGCIVCFEPGSDCADELYFDDYRACLGDRKLRKMSYTPRVPREQNGNHTALNLSYRAAQSAYTGNMAALQPNMLPGRRCLALVGHRGSQTLCGSRRCGNVA
jgi:hypothetical protein